MTSKERIMNAILGKETDRVPWSPFLAYYWEHLPESERACGQVEYMKKMGADPLLRGFNLLFRAEYKNCEISETVSGGRSVRKYEAAVSHEDLVTILREAQQAPSWKNQQTSRCYAVETTATLEPTAMLEVTTPKTSVAQQILAAVLLRQKRKRHLSSQVSPTILSTKKTNRNKQRLRLSHLHLPYHKRLQQRWRS